MEKILEILILVCLALIVCATTVLIQEKYKIRLKNKSYIDSIKKK